jgi:hypothetical protein
LGGCCGERNDELGKNARDHFVRDHRNRNGGHRVYVHHAVDCHMKTLAIFILILASFMLGQYLDQDLIQQKTEAK